MPSDSSSADPNSKSNSNPAGRMVVLVGCLLLGSSGPTLASTIPASVLTYHNENGRTGLNSSETILTPGNVAPSSFGKVFSYPVDGYYYAQPLYVPGVAVSGRGTHNVVYVATTHDSVYAFDADSNQGGNAGPLWHVSFIDPGN